MEPTRFVLCNERVSRLVKFQSPTGMEDGPKAFFPKSKNADKRVKADIRWEGTLTGNLARRFPPSHLTKFRKRSNLFRDTAGQSIVEKRKELYGSKQDEGERVSIWNRLIATNTPITILTQLVQLKDFQWEASRHLIGWNRQDFQLFEQSNLRRQSSIQSIQTEIQFRQTRTEVCWDVARQLTSKQSQSSYMVEKTGWAMCKVDDSMFL